ncbi:hypothetical protein NX773_21575 [Massilia solisilvae]|uniref:Transcriptional regulator n=1 Tax=Massilia solisilvae TaxID=1811225 RepID=A0ABT2BQH6_9BURK|nr:PhaM family polyhydroxyalkanoate granule multifunctional regulatory protein [Massilia solisilvae]MCS0610765.1 hypothetical protein [Massilia solisilvae]
MPNPPPVPPIPGMTDTLEFVKNLWGGMNVPGAGTPPAAAMPGATVSIDDLDKRIADLKAVEAWLNMNMTMLRGTIQALEVQRGTLATLKSMSASMAQAMNQTGEQAAAMAAPFAQFFTQPGAASPAASGSAPPAGGQSKAQGAQGGQAGSADAQAAPGMPAAIAWWNLLQDQFKQAVESAMTAQDAAAKFAAAAMPPESGKTGAEQKGGGFAQPGTPKPQSSDKKS